MPVPTETFWNIKRLNVIFLVCVAALLLSTVWFIRADSDKGFREYQNAGWAWEAAMYEARLESKEYLTGEIARLDSEIKRLEGLLNADQIGKLQNQIDEAKADVERFKLKAAVAKGNIVPTTQKIEKAIASYGEGSEQVKDLREELAGYKDEFESLNARIARWKQTIRNNEETIREMREAVKGVDVEQGNLELERSSLQEKLDFVEPQTLAGKLGDKIRDEPLYGLAWTNPKRTVNQVVVPDVRTDLNFLTVETIDRCQTCHVNIDNPDFSHDNLSSFVSTQLADAMGWKTVSDDATNLVSYTFWLHAVDRLAKQQPAVASALAELDAKTLENVNSVLKAADENAIELGALRTFLEGMPLRGNSENVSANDWHNLLRWYVDDVKQIVKTGLDESQWKQLATLHRTTLTPLDGGHVRQLIEESTDDGATWAVEFDAIYVPRGEAPPDSWPND